MLPSPLPFAWHRAPFRRLPAPFAPVLLELAFTHPGQAPACWPAYHSGRAWHDLTTGIALERYSQAYALAWAPLPASWAQG